MMWARAVLAALLLLTTGGQARAGGEAADIRWTAFGVPHVRADNYHDLGLGLGFAVARDRLCVLADRIVTLRGERSKWHGPDGPAVVGFVPATNLDADLFYRVQLADGAVRRAKSKLSRDAQALAAGYAEGVNRYVRALPAARRTDLCEGAPILPMTGSDVVRAMMAIGTIWKAIDIAPFAAASVWGAGPGPQAASRRTRLPSGVGSNAWAYGGDVSATTGAIVMANPHTSWRGGDWLLMHQMHLTIPGEIDVAGADFVGLPLPVTGFNRDVAWTIEAPATVRYHLLQKMAVTEGDHPGYRLGEAQRRLKLVRMAIPVRTRDGHVATRVFQIPVSALGPLYRLPAAEHRDAGWYAVTDAGDGDARGLDQLLEMARAVDVRRLVDAVETHRGVTAHFVAGDRRGDAAFVEAGPLLGVSDADLAACRVNGAAGAPILDGSRPECGLRDKGGRPLLVQAARLPAIVTRGVVQNLNNSYHGSILGEDLQGYSRLLGSPRDHDLRLDMSAKRIGEVLSRGKVTPQDALQIVLDDRNFAAEQWLEPILAFCGGAPSAALDRACRVLASWDRRNDAASRGAELFANIWPRLSEELGLAAQSDTPSTLAAGSGDRVRAAILAAVETMDRQGTPLDRPWGEVIGQSTPGGRIALHGGSGDQGVLNVLEGADGSDGVASGTSYLQRVFWDRDGLHADALLVHGQSSDPTTPHAFDQLPYFARKALPPFPFEDAAIEAATIERRRIWARFRSR